MDFTGEDSRYTNMGNRRFEESRTRTAPEHPLNLVTPLGYHTGARWVGGEGRREEGRGGGN